ncbi:MAG TPA: endonuclease/exonuclease/phosphatase family protein [Terriglobia bacterium]|nr:endonuclease/exonuclease/phosphatase family protein [Terriglobia bacterium]
MIEPPGPADAFRILSWNIHSGIGPDGIYDLDRVIAFLQRYDADIIALQEVDSRGSTGIVPIDALRGALGEHAAEARTIVAPDGHYGHVLISRWPFDMVNLHDLSRPGREPRWMIEARLHADGTETTVVATHLGYRFVENRAQVHRLTELVGRISGSIVLMGDFNDWHRQVRRHLARYALGATTINTFPARRPLLPLDCIFCRPAHSLTRHWTDRSAAAISDHLPIIAEILR